MKMTLFASIAGIKSKLLKKPKALYMIGVIVNTVAVLIGSGLGLLLKKGIPEKWTERGKYRR